MKRGRKPLPPDQNLKVEGVRVVFYAKHDQLAIMREYARYEGVSVQEITRRCWRKIISHAQQTGILENFGTPEIHTRS